MRALPAYNFGSIVLLTRAAIASSLELRLLFEIGSSIALP